MEIIRRHTLKEDIVRGQIGFLDPNGQKGDIRIVSDGDRVLVLDLHIGITVIILACAKHEIGIFDTVIAIIDSSRVIAHERADIAFPIRRRRGHGALLVVGGNRTLKRKVTDQARIVAEKTDVKVRLRLGAVLSVLHQGVDVEAQTADGITRAEELTRKGAFLTADRRPITRARQIDIVHQNVRSRKRIRLILSYLFKFFSGINIMDHRRGGRCQRVHKRGNALSDRRIHVERHGKKHHDRRKQRTRHSLKKLMFHSILPFFICQLDKVWVHSRNSA